MAVVHRTTLTPNKLELLGSWLPAQPWYLGTGSKPELTRAGGFRLDDPQGEVGIEFMAVTDESGDRSRTYQVPFSYRGAPLGGADHALIGTAEHGVLGRRWIYDGTHDPVVVSQLFALILGKAVPQAQSTSNTPEPSVTGYFVAESDRTGPIERMTVTSGGDATDLVVHTTAVTGSPTRRPRQLTIRVNRVLLPGQDEPSAGAPEVLGGVTADWHVPDGTTVRGSFAVVLDTAPDSTAG
ncbi:1,4-alpha-glucan branching protein [Streptomyces sp. RB6PN25]|uniref:1,4-alpha-glucan branching protein n=1 Tax=Streptomyces humicola TaxID=2953240 RepID=A0ABT1PSI8_9ACTN|nr:1,4-alpha-glucan branching protein [Streptomyces humicola]MCQ4080638.1 1,4-alpha-glucan branching protein [Streptomyces humicola]